MKRLLTYFLRGLIFLVPLAVTLYVSVALFVTVDRWLGRWIPLPVPGAGVAVTVILITLFGFLASNLITRGLVAMLDQVMTRLPVVRFVYTAVKDFMSAFVGEKRRFDRPVLATLFPGGTARVFGFVTQESLDALGLAGHVAVYFPQSYNVAGNLVILPAAQVAPVKADSPAVMAFIVSGGVTAVPVPR